MICAYLEKGLEEEGDGKQKREWWFLYYHVNDEADNLTNGQEIFFKICLSDWPHNKQVRQKFQTGGWDTILCE